MTGRPVRARYCVVQDDFLKRKPLVIRDLCPPGRPTVTNDVEAVVEALVANGSLPDGRRLHYYDSDGRLDEILVRDGRFAGFAPLPQEDQA